MSCLPVSVSLSDSAMRPDADSAHKKTLLLCRSEEHTSELHTKVRFFFVWAK